MHQLTVVLVVDSSLNRNILMRKGFLKLLDKEKILHDSKEFSIRYLLLQQKLMIQQLTLKDIPDDSCAMSQPMCPVDPTSSLPPH